MVWYNPLSWFVEPIKVRCDSPNCGRIIADDSLIFQPQSRMAYHDDPNCIIDMLYYTPPHHGTRTSDCASVLEIKRISLTKARRLSREGKLAQIAEKKD